jgi:hypothetical protein
MISLCHERPLLMDISFQYSRVDSPRGLWLGTAEAAALQHCSSTAAAKTTMPKVVIALNAANKQPHLLRIRVIANCFDKMSIADTGREWAGKGAVMFDMETLLTIRETFNHAIVAGDEKFKR